MRDHGLFDQGAWSNIWIEFLIHQECPWAITCENNTTLFYCVDWFATHCFHYHFRELGEPVMPVCKGSEPLRLLYCLGFVWYRSLMVLKTFDESFGFGMRQTFQGVSEGWAGHFLERERVLTDSSVNGFWSCWFCWDNFCGGRRKAKVSLWFLDKAVVLYWLKLEKVLWFGSEGRCAIVPR